MFEVSTIISIGSLLVRAAEHDPTVQADVHAIVEKFRADVTARLDAAAKQI
jgi:hypothetical protein